MIPYRPQQFRKKIENRLLGTITRVATNEPLAALTFDDGPNPLYTAQYADLLEQYNARGTFFVIGRTAAEHRSLITRLTEKGHSICCHSWDHTSFVSLSRSQRIRQLKKCKAALSPDLDRLFRPPFGHQNLSSTVDVRLLGYEIVTWDILAQDWLDDEAETISRRVGEKLRSGSIVLFHDNLHDYLDERYRDRSASLAAVEMLLKEYRDRYQFVTVPKLLRHGTPFRKRWRMAPDEEWMKQLQSSRPGQKA